MVEMIINQDLAPKTKLWNIFRIHASLQLPLSEFMVNSINLFFTKFYLSPSPKTKNQIRYIKFNEYYGIEESIKNVMNDRYLYSGNNTNSETETNITIQHFLHELREAIFSEEKFHNKTIIISKNNFMHLLFDMLELIDENEKDYKKIKRFFFNPNLLYFFLS